MQFNPNYTDYLKKISIIENYFIILSVIFSNVENEIVQVGTSDVKFKKKELVGCWTD